MIDFQPILQAAEARAGGTAALHDLSPCDLGEDKGGFGAYLAGWPGAEMVGLWRAPSHRTWDRPHPDPHGCPCRRRQLDIRVVRREYRSPNKDRSLTEEDAWELDNVSLGN